MDNRTEYNYKWYTRIMREYRFSSFSLPVLNPAIRLILRTFYQVNRFILSAMYMRKSREIEKWLKSTDIFFGLAVSRSGTSFISNLLKRESPDALIEHEANVLDFIEFSGALHSEEKADRYISSYRLKEIYHRAHSHKISIYGEISPHLRQHCRALRKSLPDAFFFHLVRDGRDVVSSLMARGRLGRKDPILSILKPPKDDPYASEWPSMSVFERVCWLWQHDNRRLRESTDITIQFEKILSDYSYFKTRLLDSLNLKIDRETWASYISTPVNVTPEKNRPHWQNWSKEEMEKFHEICGEEMRKNGYSSYTGD